MVVFLRSEKNYLVHEEMTMVRESLKMLNTHIGYCFKKLFSIYRRDPFLDGFDAIVSILKKLVKMNSEFDLDIIDQPLEELMENYFKVRIIILVTEFSRKPPTLSACAYFFRFAKY